jgi:hypothetical protein
MDDTTCIDCGASFPDHDHLGDGRRCDHCAQARRDAMAARLAEATDVGGKSSTGEDQIITPATEDRGRHWVPISERRDVRRRRYKHE